MNTPAESNKQIPGFPNHFLTPDSFIFSLRSGRKLARRWTKKGWTSRVPDRHGVVRILYHDSLPVADAPDISVVTRTLRLAPIPGYPGYLVSPEGAVYRVSFGKSAKGSVPRAVPVSEHLRGFQSYVNVVSWDGTRHSRNVNALVQAAHGSETGPPTTPQETA